MIDLISSYQNDILGIETITGLIPKNHLSIIEISGDYPESWNQLGYLYFLIDNEDFGNRNPIIKSASLRPEGYLYIPDHNYDYKIVHIARPWLVNVNPRLVFNVSIAPLPTEVKQPTVQDVINITKSRQAVNIPPVTINAISPTKILSSNPRRIGLLLKNNSNTLAYFSIDNIVSNSDFEYRRARNEILEITLPYTGEIWGICENNTAVIGGIEFIDEAP